MSESQIPQEATVDQLSAAELLKLGLSSEQGSSHLGESSRFVPPTLELLADRFPDLEFLEPLGYGGMGCVYKVRQKHLDRIVALKILPVELSQDPAFAERFAREARMLAKLSHPNIVTIHDFGQAEEFSFLVMEYLDGMNLREVLRTGGMEPESAIALISSLAGALDYAHEEGVVHRDIKPENILFDRRGHVKLADFGLAKLAHPTGVDPTLTLTRQALGTPHYMAPEQWEAPQDVDHRADIYALGVVGYEMLTGRLPIGKFDAPSTISKLSSSVDDVIHKALHRDPAKRYQHAREIKRDLEPVLAKSSPLPWIMIGDNQPASLKKWEAQFRDWAADYWPSQPMRNSMSWAKNEFVIFLRAVGRLIAGLPWGAIAGFALIIVLMNAYWVVGETENTRRRYEPGRNLFEETYTYTRGYDSFNTYTNYGVISVLGKAIDIRVENYWIGVAAGGILFLALLRPVLGVRADLLALLLAGYGIYHMWLFFETPPSWVIAGEQVQDVEYRAAPLLAGLTFFVLLISIFWSIVGQIFQHFRATPPENRHVFRSIYESLLGLAPRQHVPVSGEGDQLPS